MPRQETKQGVKCPECPKVFKDDFAWSEHYQKEHQPPEVDDSFYDDDSWMITLIPSSASTRKK